MRKTQHLHLTLWEIRNQETNSFKPPALFLYVSIPGVVTLINCVSVKLATSIQNIFCLCKLIAIAIIICGGAYRYFAGNVDIFANSKNVTPSMGALAVAFYSGLWAYDGWNNLNYVTEEIQNPKKNLPLAIAIAIPLVTVCYVLVNMAYLTVMSPAEMAISDAVAVVSLSQF